MTGGVQIRAKAAAAEALRKPFLPFSTQECLQTEFHDLAFCFQPGGFERL